MFWIFLDININNRHWSHILDDWRAISLFVPPAFLSQSHLPEASNFATNTSILPELDNVVLTPHIGAYAKEIRMQMEMEAVENLIKGLNEV